ncbi:MFS transporter [Fodinicola feengrottensis]|uniref:MFS transporter n=1 Tax=Fodinicola feengrottensis TaxID=435914 RepID=A0ABN2ICI5_9ACTN
MHVLERPRTAGRNLTFVAALLGLLMAQLDGAVVIAALPSIQHDLHGTAIAGVTAVYGLAVTVATPLHGRLGDMYGRRVTFSLSIAIFALGSVACALAPSLVFLVGARAIQGLGGSGLIVAAVSVLAEMFDKEELLRRQGWMTAVAAIAFVGGPPIGGLIAGQFGWQWIFGLNLPICAVALAIGFAGLPHRNSSNAKGGFDFPGAGLVVVGGASLVALGSSENVATNPLVAVPLLIVAVVSTILLVRVEKSAASPLISPRLFVVPAVARSVLASGLSGVTLFGTFTFMSLAIVATVHSGPTGTGLLLVPMTAGQLLLTTTFSLLARKFPQLTAWGRLGLALGVAGLSLIALAIVFSQPYALICGLVLSGAALGLSMQVYTLLVQSFAPKESIGAAMGTLSFSRQIGNVLGTAIFGWVAALLANPSGGLVAIFALAAAVTVVALVTSPGQPAGS